MRDTTGVVPRQDYRLWARHRSGGHGGRSHLAACGIGVVSIWLQRAFALLTLALTAVGTGMLYVWAFDTSPPVEVSEAKPVQELFRYGEPIAIEQHLTVDRKCQGIVSRAVVDGAGFVYPLLLATDPIIQTGDNRVRVEFKLPEILGPGKYRYREVAQWRCNPLSDINQVLVDVPFTVVR